MNRAANLLGITQPAVSKLLANFEAEAGIQLFDRSMRRLVVTARGMQLYKEIDRIFAGLRQVERSIDLIKREELERLVIGVMPALSGPSSSASYSVPRSIAQRSTFNHGAQLAVHCDWVATRQMDIGFVNDPFEHPGLRSEVILDEPLVCIMPKGHPLEANGSIEPKDLEGIPFVSFRSDTEIRQHVDAALKEHGVTTCTAVEATNSQTVCELVAGGLGISLVHPLLAHAVRSSVTIRRFDPSIMLGFLLCCPRELPNTRLTEEFLQATRSAVAELSGEIRRAGSDGNIRSPAGSAGAREVLKHF